MKRDRIIDEFPEPERYELREGAPYRFDLSRREFVQLLGAGILISLTGTVSFAQRAGRGASGTGAQRLHIDTNGLITVLTSKVEAGQGSRTQLTQAAAEELRVSVEQIRLIMADTELTPDDGGTAGSRTTPSSVPAIRKGCAAARELLRETAAAQFRADKAGLSVQAGQVHDPASGKKFGYADLARMDNFKEALARSANPELLVAPVSEWQVLGTPVSKVNGRALVTGEHRYPSDIRRSDMLHGTVLRPPSYGASLTAIDLAPAQAMKNVTVVRDGQFVGFAAPTSFLARQAMETVARTATWETRPHPPSDELYTYLREHGAARGGRGGRSGGGAKGSVEQGLAAAKTVLRETFHIACIQHAPMEPRAAVAEWEDGKLTVWTGSQQPSRVRQDLAEAFHLNAEKVRVIVPDTGGGFGGKHTGEVAVEAARLALAAKRPVALRWTREEEFTWAYFRPAGVIDIAAGLAPDGALTAWEQVNFNSGASAIATPYDVPNTRAEFKACASPMREGSYRALASTANVFARESVMDGLAAGAGVDPLAFRLRHLSDPRLRAVLEQAARKFNWTERRKQTKGSKSKGVGLACGTEKGSFVAACVDLEVDPNAGRYQVLEVCEAFECGAIQNPANLRAQVEGCILQGLGGALREEIQFQDGRVLNANFSKYQVPRFKDVPRIETLLVNRPDLPSVGAGETPIVAIAPAIANALFAATGVRIRSLPIRNERFQSV